MSEQIQLKQNKPLIFEEKVATGGKLSFDMSFSLLCRNQNTYFHSFQSINRKSTK